MNMEKCSNCKVKYPHGFLSPILGAGGTGNGVCGICALKLSNRALGISRSSFSGEIAEEMRQAALEFRKTGRNIYA